MKKVALGLVIALIFLILVSGCQRALQTESQKFTLRIKAEKLSPEVAKAIEVGDLIREKTSGSDIGKITSIETTAALRIVPTDDGRLVATSSPYYKDVFIDVEGEGVFTSRGLKVGGAILLVGNPVEFATQKATFRGTVINFKKVD